MCCFGSGGAAYDHDHDDDDGENAGFGYKALLTQLLPTTKLNAFSSFYMPAAKEQTQNEASKFFFGFLSLSLSPTHHSFSFLGK